MYAKLYIWYIHCPSQVQGRKVLSSTKQGLNFTFIQCKLYILSNVKQSFLKVTGILCPEPGKMLY